MGVDHVGLFLFHDAAQDAQRARHQERVALVQRRVVAADARLLQLALVDAAIGNHGDVPAFAVQLLGQLDDVRFRAADLEPHEHHQDFFAHWMLSRA